MVSLLFTLTSFLIALGILIAVHEFGHFWVARRLGVRILRFSIGFGHIVWRRVSPKDGTEYALSALPLGGYVKMLDEREAPVVEADLPWTFNRQALWKRSAIVVAGPLANLLFAILALWVVLVSGDLGLRPLIGAVAPESIAQQAGLKAGDEFLAIDAKPTPTWEAAALALMALEGSNQAVALRIQDAQGREWTRWLPRTAPTRFADNPNVIEAAGLTPALPEIPPRIGDVVSGEPAEQAGLRMGDLILSADGRPVTNWRAWVDYIRARPGQAIHLQVRRHNATLDMRVTPRPLQEGTRIVGRIGAGVDSNLPVELYAPYQVMVRLGPLEALEGAVNKTWNLSALMLDVLGRMLVGRASLENLSGPISIAESAGKSASSGWTKFLKFLAIVSISLGILNLLPIPILDGGHLLFFLIEGVKGSPLSEQAQLVGQRVGAALLTMLMTLAFYMDISRLVG